MTEGDFLKFYTKMTDILNDLGFNIVDEYYAEWWTVSPLYKPSVRAIKEKDRFTSIEVQIKWRWKKPLQSMRESADTLKIELSITGSVMIDYGEGGRSIFYKAFTKLLELLHRKDYRKYREECEELVIEIAQRGREIYGSLPAIGRSKQEYYRPVHRQS